MECKCENYGIHTDENGINYCLNCKEETETITLKEVKEDYCESEKNPTPLYLRILMYPVVCVWEMFQKQKTINGN